MHYRVRHITRVTYAGEVRLARFNLRLRPAHWPGQQIADYRLRIDPRPTTIASDTGPFVVNRSHLTIREPLTELTIESRFTASVADHPPVAADDPGPTLADIRETALTVPDLSALGPAAYLFASPIAAPVPAIARWAARLPAADTILTFAHTLTAATHAHFTYDDTATRADTPPAEAFITARGVCQDFAHVMIVAARALGIPAAYVSGYLRTLPPPGQPRLIGADAMHAWVALWCGEQLGWIGFDPTNNALCGGDYIVVGMGRDYADVAPIDGVFFGGGGQQMEVSVDVEEIAEEVEEG